MGGHRRRLGLTVLSPLLLFRLNGDAGSFVVLLLFGEYINNHFSCHLFLADKTVCLPTMVQF